GDPIGAGPGKGDCDAQGAYTLSTNSTRPSAGDSLRHGEAPMNIFDNDSEDDEPQVPSEDPAQDPISLTASQIIVGNCAHMQDIAATEPGRLRKPLCDGGSRSSWGRDVAAAAAAPRGR